MELRLKGYGTIEITKATLVDGGDILIEAADNFEKLAETTDYEITETYLTESDYGWGLVVLLDIPDDDWFVEDAMVFDVENTDIAHRLKAFL